MGRLTRLVLEEFSKLYYNDEVTRMSVLTFIVNNTPQEDLPTTAAQTAQYLQDTRQQLYR